MAVSYLALVEYNFRGDNPQVLHKFFTNRRAQKESPKTWQQADQWISDMLRECGTHDVRCSISRVEFCISG